jgi:hypothetical protein
LSIDQVSQRVELFDEAEINPSAIFYTDHSAMKSIESRIASKVDSSNAFWRTSR